jgi:translation elongation factor P/translation initiation factor 5A
LKEPYEARLTELRVGNVIMNGKDPMVVLRAEYNKSGRMPRL